MSMESIESIESIDSIESIESIENIGNMACWEEGKNAGGERIERSKTPRRVGGGDQQQGRGFLGYSASSKFYFPLLVLSVHKTLQHAKRLMYRLFSPHVGTNSYPHFVTHILLPQ